LAGLAFSVWVCSAAERILGQRDPASVVCDEIAAMPVCFLAWLGLVAHQTGQMPAAGYFFSRANWPLTLGVFAAFRFFDIVKPWPVSWADRKIKGGFGIMLDDALAAAYVLLLMLIYRLVAG